MAINVNDIQHDWGTITVKVNGVEIVGIKSISYSDAIEREKVYGAGRLPLGMTPGKYTTEQGSMTVFERQFREILLAFGNDWGNTTFETEVRYAATGLPTQVDIVEGCLWAGAPGGGEEGAAPLERELKFDYLRVKRNGLYLVAPATA